MCCQTDRNAHGGCLFEMLEAHGVTGPNEWDRDAGRSPIRIAQRSWAIGTIVPTQVGSVQSKFERS